MTEPRDASFVALLRKIREDVSAEDQNLTAAERQERIQAAVATNPLLSRLFAKAESPESRAAAIQGRRPTSSATGAEPTPRA